MHLRRFLLGIVVALASTGLVRAQIVNLTEEPLHKRSVRIELTMELEGKIRIKQDGKEQQFPHSASAKPVFVERSLDVKDGSAEKAARHYTTAESAIRFNND